MNTITPAQRQQLKGLAHGLEPVVLIGNAGLTPAVLKEIDLSLKAHELIKVKAGGAEREDRAAWLTQICDTLGALPVQHIGKILVIYRENPKQPAAAPARKTPTRGKPSARAATPAGARPASRAKPVAGRRAPARIGTPIRARTADQDEAPGRARAPARPRAAARPGAKPRRRD